MFRESQSQFETTRIPACYRHFVMGNGTSVADALSSALDLDLRISGRLDGAEVLNALREEEIDKLAAQLQVVFEVKHFEFTLPLGTIVKSHAIGEVRFGGEAWALDAGRPGLHPAETMRRDAHGPNFDLLLAEIKRATRKLACRRLGFPQPVFIVDSEARHLLQFPPCQEAGGVVLQLWANGTEAPRFAAASSAQIIEFAESVVADMRTFWKRRKAIAIRAKEVRDLVDAVAVEHDAEIQLVAVDLSYQREDENIDMYVQYLAVDEAMRTGPVLDFLPCRDHITSEFYFGPFGVTRRPEDLAKLRSLGADGRIDDMAAAVATVAPGGAAAVFAKLATEYETTFEVPTGGAPMFVTLYWRDGTIKAEISMAGSLDWCRTELEILGHSLPETVIDTLPGRTVERIAELPFACPCKVERAESLTRGLRLRLQVGERLIHLSSGRIWDEPIRKR
ncbi:hypothetical protein [Sphingomonas sp. BAUL-RG-20F-R05-02]|uniref:hypothetical protein n=1 Tax=Sphingomonas sp. BAUL-RG-20F-R05-02 TaxID=2914830 RepID=UPI001F564266|nr:hypothetical protein [Sphingomonas sp. BAUL-RG-20F-R05-02]